MTPPPPFYTVAGLYVVLSREPVDEILYGVTIRMKPSFQLYFHTVLFIQYVALTFESVDEILLCYYSNNKTSLDLT